MFVINENSRTLNGHTLTKGDKVSYYGDILRVMKVINGFSPAGNPVTTVMVWDDINAETDSFTVSR